MCPSVQLEKPCQSGQDGLFNTVSPTQVLPLVLGCALLTSELSLSGSGPLQMATYYSDLHKSGGPT